MANDYFKFKQFTVHQGSSAMKVGTDGVVLGAVVPLKGERNILDVGTGTGLVALMLAQRCPTANIDALEKDENAAHQAAGNFLQSPWNNRLKTIHNDFTHFMPQIPYDLIVSNPPYFIQSLKAPEQMRSLARHADTLSPELLLQKCSSWLVPQGRLVMIVPTPLEETLLQKAEILGWSLSWVLRVFPKPGTVSKRSVLQWQREPVELCIKQYLTIETGVRHQYTEEFRKITADFYLAH